jgi:hypothetical protein
MIPYTYDGIKERSDEVPRQTKRLFPKRMQADFINAGQGIDRHAQGELYTEHVKSMRNGESLPQTLTDESVVYTPRGQADLRAYEEKHATVSLKSLPVSERLAFIKRMNSFRVDDNIVLHFRGREWVFLKTVGAKEIFSVIYTTKAEALRDYDRKRIYWA